MTARFFAGTTLSATMTAALLFLMLTLIDTGENVINDKPKRHFLPFVHVPPPEAPPAPDPKPKRPTPPEVLPSLPPITDVGPGAVAINVGPGMTQIPTFQPQGLAVMENSSLMPVVKSQPPYPPRALERGIEGFVIVEYTVTPSGTVQHVQVIESSNSVFHKAAIAAASKFRYKPRVIDGQAVTTTGVRNRFSFMIDE